MIGFYPTFPLFLSNRLTTASLAESARDPGQVIGARP